MHQNDIVLDLSDPCRGMSTAGRHDLLYAATAGLTMAFDMDQVRERSELTCLYGAV